MLTHRQKTKFAPILRKTLEGVSQDLGKLGARTIDDIIQIVCDAHRPVTIGGMSKEDYRILIASYGDPDTERWLKRVLE